MTIATQPADNVHRASAKVASPIPNPPGHFLVGHIPEFRRDILNFYETNSREYGDLFGFRLGPHRLVMINHPDLIEQVLVTQNRKFVKHWILHLLRPVLGNGLLNSDGEFWLRQRRLIQPLFSTARVASYGHIAVEQTKRWMADWRDGEIRDVHLEMKRLTLLIVARALLDIDVSEDFEVVAEAIDVIQRDFSNRFTSTFRIPIWIPTPSNLKVKRAIERLDALIYRIIQQRRTTESSSDDLLSRLLAAREQGEQTGMTDRQLRDEIMTLFLAGHETTAITLAWTLYLLARHPDVQQKVRDELRTVFGVEQPRTAELSQLELTRNVVRESMRLFPPAYAFGRHALEPCRLGEFEVPAKTTVLVIPWVTHRDSRFYPEPDEFLPERWTPAFEAQLPKYAYMPFGGGPRRCIGDNFAMMESQLALAMLLQRFTFETVTDEPVIPIPAVTLQPGCGVPLCVRLAG